MGIAVLPPSAKAYDRPVSPMEKIEQQLAQAMSIKNPAARVRMDIIRQRKELLRLKTWEKIPKVKPEELLKKKYINIDEFGNAIGKSLGSDFTTLEFSSYEAEVMQANGFFDPKSKLVGIGKKSSEDFVKAMYGDKSVSSFNGLRTVVHEFIHGTSPLFKTRPSSMGKLPTWWAYFEEGLTEKKAREMAARIMFKGKKVPSWVAGASESYTSEVAAMNWFEKKFGKAALEEVWLSTDRAMTMEKKLKPWLKNILTEKFGEKEALRLVNFMEGDMFHILRVNFQDDIARLPAKELAKQIKRKFGVSVRAPKTTVALDTTKKYTHLDPAKYKDIDDYAEAIGKAMGSDYSAVDFYNQATDSMGARGYYDQFSRLIGISKESSNSFAQALLGRNTDASYNGLKTVVHEFFHGKSPLIKYMRKNKKVLDGWQFWEEGLVEKRAKTLASEIMFKGKKAPAWVSRAGQSYETEVAAMDWFEKKFGKAALEKVWVSTDRAKTANSIMEPWIKGILEKKFGKKQASEVMRFIEGDTLTLLRTKLAYRIEKMSFEEIVKRLRIDFSVPKKAFGRKAASFLDPKRKVVKTIRKKAAKTVSKKVTTIKPTDIEYSELEVDLDAIGRKLASKGYKDYDKFIKELKLRLGGKYNTINYADEHVVKLNASGYYTPAEKHIGYHPDITKDVLRLLKGELDVDSYDSVRVVIHEMYHSKSPVWGEWGSPITQGYSFIEEGLVELKSRRAVYNMFYKGSKKVPSWAKTSSKAYVENVRAVEWMEKKWGKKFMDKLWAAEDRTVIIHEKIMAYVEKLAVEKYGEKEGIKLFKSIRLQTQSWNNKNTDGWKLFRDELIYDMEAGKRLSDIEYTVTQLGVGGF